MTKPKLLDSTGTYEVDVRQYTVNGRTVLAVMAEITWLWRDEGLVPNYEAVRALLSYSGAHWYEDEGDGTFEIQSSALTDSGMTYSLFEDEWLVVTDDRDFYVMNDKAFHLTHTEIKELL